jgi:ferritin-like metal-binding protein YciE
MEAASLETLFLDTVKDIYYAEHKIRNALPKMAQSAQSPDLKAAFEKHLSETEVQIGRLEQVFEMMGEKAEAKPCEAIEGIIREGEEIMTTYATSSALDAGLVASAQAVEHYEIARYGTLASWANALGMSEAEALFEESLVEEIETDTSLSDLAESSINGSAVSDGV